MRWPITDLAPTPLSGWGLVRVLVAAGLPILGVAAFAVLVPVVLYLTPSAVGSAATYECAVAVTAGAATLALSALVTAVVVAGDAERDAPLV